MWWCPACKRREAVSRQTTNKFLFLALSNTPLVPVTQSAGYPCWAYPPTTSAPGGGDEHIRRGCTVALATVQRKIGCVR